LDQVLQRTGRLLSGCGWYFGSGCVTLAGKRLESIDVLYIGQWLVFGIVVDKLSVLIGAALGLVGF
jgi:hypothetical protein